MLLNPFKSFDFSDLACEFLGDEWFIYDLADSLGIVSRNERDAWMYAEPYNDTDQYLPRIAGYTKKFLSGDLSFDLVTVKGAGHFVPLDRPVILI
jgi:cathepsin A (carboxypeptidase C)